MNSVLSLIADKAKMPLDTGWAERARGSLSAAGLETQDPVWLSQNEALEVEFSGDPDAAHAALVRQLPNSPVDVAVTPAGNRRRKLLIADMDSTLIEQECIDELAAEIGAGPHVAAITEKAMRGEIAFKPALRQRVALLKGLPVTIVDKVLAERITLTPGGQTLVATMKANGAHTVLVSGGVTVFADRIGEHLGIDEVHANVLDAENGKFTGRVNEPILGRDAKRDALIAAARANNIATADCLAVGDGANDLTMIGIAGLGVAFHAKPQVRATADVAINNTDLTALLYLQGYHRSEFVG